MPRCKSRLWLVLSLAALIAWPTVPTSAAPSAPPAIPPGRGTGIVQAALARVFVGGSEFRLGDVSADATLDPARRNLAESRALGEFAVVRTTGTGADTVFPDPPLQSQTAKGKHHGGLDPVTLAVPAARVDSTPAKEAVGRLLPPQGGEPAPRRPAPRPVERGEIAEGEIRPATLSTVLEDGVAAVASRSDIGRVSLLGGVTTVDGAGLGDDKAWADGDHAGAEARSLHVRSATVLETGALLSLLGLDPHGVLDDARRALEAALGPGAVPPASDPLSVPLIALTDVSATSQAVAAVDAEGVPMASAVAQGSVGGVYVGPVEVGSFSTDETAETWDSLERRVQDLIDKVLGTLGERYKGSVQVRILPRLSLATTTKGDYVSARAEMALLAVRVAPPPPADDPAPGGPGVPVTLPAPELPAVVGGGAETGLVGMLPRADAAEEPPPVTIEMASMEVEAEHTREGVTLDCGTFCGEPDDPTNGSSRSIVNRSWAPESGFGAPSTASDLPRTGGQLAWLPLAAMASLGLATVSRSLGGVLRDRNVPANRKAPR